MMHREPSVREALRDSDNLLNKTETRSPETQVGFAETAAEKPIGPPGWRSRSSRRSCCTSS